MRGKKVSKFRGLFFYVRGSRGGGGREGERPCLYLSSFTHLVIFIACARAPAYSLSLGVFVSITVLFSCVYFWDCVFDMCWESLWVMSFLVVCVLFDVVDLCICKCLRISDTTVGLQKKHISQVFSWTWYTIYRFLRAELLCASHFPFVWVK